MLEIDGLVLDATITHSGKDFYNKFCQNWIPPAGARGYHILIKELPSRGANIAINVLVNDKEVVYRVFQPEHDLLEQLAEQSASHIHRMIKQYEHISVLGF